MNVAARIALLARDREPVIVAIAAMAAIAYFATRYAWSELSNIPIWHHYADQSLYLQSARALAAFDLDPVRHHYPPLYSLLAAPFTHLVPSDPFLIINVLCLAGSVALLVALFGSVIGYPIAALLAFGLLLFRQFVDMTFVLPWNSTLVTLLIFAALYSLMRLERGGRAGPLQSFIFSLFIGLIVPTRPLDAIVALALYPFWLAALWGRLGAMGRATRFRSMLRHLAALAFGGLVGPLFFVGFNLTVFGQPTSPYTAPALSLFVFGEVSEKFVSIFLDSASLYLEPVQTILARFPWAVLAVVALPLCLALGPLWLKAASILIVLQCALYIAYVDLLPNGLYNFANIHYFRWALWLAFLAVPASAVLAYQRSGVRSWLIVGATVVIALLVGGLQLRTTEFSLPVLRTDAALSVELPRGRRVKYVDVPGLTASFRDTYLSGPEAILDGKGLSPGFEIRALPSPHGVRFLFIRSADGGQLVIPAKRWRVPAELSFARAGDYSFALGPPRWLFHRGDDIRPREPLRVDEAISRHVFSAGFGDFDGRGRSIGAVGTLALALPPRSAPYMLHLTIDAAGPAGFEIAIDGQSEARRSLALVPGLNQIAFVIPSVAASAWSRTLVRLHPQRSANETTVPTIKVTGMRVD